MIAETPLHLGKQVIITPHLGEAARLLATSVDAIAKNKIEACFQLHEKYGCSVLLKDAVSVLYDGNKMSLNVVGTPALAKGGSGDLLAGLLCALLAQNRGENMMRSMQAACLWMGMAAQKVQGKRYQATVNSNDIIEALGYCCI
jgi:NAD(P)H-hydrate epimerase